MIDGFLLLGKGFFSATFGMFIVILFWNTESDYVAGQDL